jgi:UDP-N-acetylmuramoyl-L-alanyl-D-glutamate--2,6-diaminopimelate ligase
MRITHLSKSIPGLVQVLGYEHQDVTSLCTDSRKVEKGALFFCIPGLRTDAHDFAPQAVAAGAVALVVERKLDIDCAQILVPSVREALSYIAAEFYGNPAKQLKLVGVTGTKGKTTTSFLIKSILEAAGHKVGLMGTVCSMIGEREIPANLTTPDPIDFQRLLRQMADEGMEYVVMEVSAHALALKKLEGMVFDVAGFTNLSQDHLDFFKEMETYLATKLRLFTTEMCRAAVVNVDDERVAAAFQELQIPYTRVGIRSPADVYANDIEIGERGLTYRLTFHKRAAVDVELRMAGIFNVYNSLMAAAMCDVVGVEPDAIKRGLESVKGVPGRIELLETETPYRVILDYAHSPDALENILSTIRQTTKAGRVIALFGCGGDRDHDKRPIMGEIGGRLADFCILTSDNPRSEDPGEILSEIEKGIKRVPDAKYVVIENRRKAIAHALEMARPGDVVVLAGKGHETYQEIKGVKHPFDEKVVVKELLEKTLVHEV